MRKDENVTVLKAKTGWLELDLKELVQYRDLIFLFVKRNYTTRYKQTILGSLWLILNPLISVVMYSFVFGNVAGLASDGCPQFLFYLVSNTIWAFFASCLSQTASTFTANAGVFGKVYFPRLVTPISTVLTAAFDCAIQIVMIIAAMIVYGVVNRTCYPTEWLPCTILLLVQVGLLGLGFGIIISSLTTKYRDLAVLVSFGVQLWMYASPVVYSLEKIPQEYMTIYMCNPMSPIICVWRYAWLGTGYIPYTAWGISWIVTIAVLCIGIILFNRVEKTFMDTV